MDQFNVVNEMDKSDVLNIASAILDMVDEGNVDEIKSFVNDKLIGKTVQVTERDIRHGTANSASDCAIALTLKRELYGPNDVFVGTRQCNIIYTKICGDTKENMVVNVANDIEVSKWIHAFDEGEVDTVKLQFVSNDDDENDDGGERFLVKLAVAKGE